ncbi:MAG: hypothetical protein COT00_03470 [Candidatus Omnitrophica bacterium CG07_land_8_20_14_0_80_50_8]|nr:MAG: hypothetical protein COT00_03470 [Candidatus Omnitrophica bacterium CG07_land_8_20_14_0_80_50_8]
MVETADGVKIEVGDVVRWGETNDMGAVEKIRIINSGQGVASYSGNLEGVILVVRSAQGTASVWPKKEVIEKVDRVAAKNFLAQLSKKIKTEKK